MPNHPIFNERPESQDRALKELQAMGYQYIPRAEAEQKRGHLSHVLFPDVMREFLASQSYIYRGKQMPFPEDAIAEAIRELDAPLERGLMFSSKVIYDRLIYGKSCDVNLYDGNTQSFDISYIDWEHPENNIWQVTDEFSVERTNGKYARPDIVILVNGIPLVVIECKKSSVDVEEGVKQNVRNWQPDYIPQLFKFAQLVMAMNPESVKYGTAGTKADFYCKWHEEDVQWQEDAAKRYVDDGHITEQDKIIVSMLSKQRLLNLISYLSLNPDVMRIRCSLRSSPKESEIPLLNIENPVTKTFILPACKEWLKIFARALQDIAILHRTENEVTKKQHRDTSVAVLFLSLND